MDVSRRDFLRYSAAAGSATGLGGLIGSGVNLGPVVARAQELKIKGAKVTPSVCPSRSRSESESTIHEITFCSSRFSVHRFPLERPGEAEAFP